METLFIFGLPTYFGYLRGGRRGAVAGAALALVGLTAFGLAVRSGVWPSAPEGRV